MKFWIGAFLLFASSVGSHAQAVLSGQIIFTQGTHVASGWAVVLTTSPNVQEFRTKSDSEGRFRFENLPSGLANLTVTGDEGLYIKTIHELWINAVKPNELSIEIEPIQVLGEAVVTAEAFRSTNESPLSIKSIGWAEMQRMPGAVLDLSKVIQSFPGILPKPSFGYAISLRGVRQPRTATALTVLTFRPSTTFQFRAHQAEPSASSTSTTFKTRNSKRAPSPAASETC